MWGTLYVPLNAERYAQHTLQDLGYFTIRQVAAGIFSPEISCSLRRPNPGVAVTNLLITTPCTASFERPGALLKTRHQGVCRIHPYF